MEPGAPGPKRRTLLAVAGSLLAIPRTSRAESPALGGREVRSLDDFGATGDGRTFDDLAVVAATGVSSGQTLRARGTASYRISSNFSFPALAWGFRLNGEGARFLGASPTDLFVLSGECSLDDIEARGFHTPVVSRSQLAKPADILLSNLTLNDSSAPAVDIRGSFSRAEITDSTIAGAVDRGVALGHDDPDAQEGWGRAVVLRNHIAGVRNSGRGQTIGILSYAAGGTLIAFNHLSDIGGAQASGEVDGVYTKAAHSIVLGNHAEGLRTTSPSRYYFNQKGAPRGQGRPVGYGGLWGFNLARGGGEGIGLQLQSGEGTAALNAFEQVAVGVEIGSESADFDIVLGNRAILNGRPGSRGESISAAHRDGAYLSAINAYRDVETGVSLGAAEGLDGALFLGHNIELNEAIGANGFNIRGAPGKPVQGLRISLPLVANGKHGISLTDVQGALIDAPTFLNLGATESPILLSRCRDLHVRGLRRSLVDIPANEAVRLFVLGLSEGDSLVMRCQIAGATENNDAAFAFTLEGYFWCSGGHLVALADPVLSGGARHKNKAPIQFSGMSFKTRGAELEISVGGFPLSRWNGSALLDILKY